MEQAWIPMKDGVRLAATLYMPDGAKPGEKFPALLEYLPYRKDDGTAAGDYPKHTYFARRGYVSVRVDIRGFGASEGVPPEREYSEQEQTDGEQVIAWLASQPWSNGNVGMFGISWGGFTALQMAMRHPPALKAIIAICATAELFHDDVHYIDGMAHIDEFELNMDLAEGWVGAPEYSLDEKVLGPRFDSAPWSLLYLKHQHDGPFWRDRVRPLSEITTPSFLIGGMQDGYRDSIPDMLMQSKAPIKAIVGPWNHSFPNDADFGPRVEWRDQAVRWFDHWLKGRDTGVEHDPRLVVYMQHWHPPDPNLESVPGEWRREDVWPPKDAHSTTLFLQGNHTLADSATAPAEQELKYIPTIGVEAGFWWGELLSDPRPVDAFSLVYDSAPLENDVAILGRPHALLQASSTASSGRLVCAALRRSSRRHSHADYRRGNQRCAAGIDECAAGSGARQGLSARHRNAFDLVGVSQGPSHSRRDFKCAVAHGAADAVRHDHVARTGRQRRIAPGAAGCSSAG